ncbi:MAG: hypothetical protein HON90_01355 [Halobacteriovoraceae bacterium]|nr:hypothetical protein [Halobacteriovoraceae bacterium]
MAIDFSEFSEAKNTKKWLDAALKSLKLNDASELEKKLNYRSCEGVSLKSDYPQEIKALQLNSFPSTRKLACYSNQQEQSIALNEVDLIITHSESFKGAAQIVTTIKKLTENSLLDIFAIVNNFQVSELTEFITSIKKQNFKTYISSAQVHNAGGSIVQELSFLLGLIKFNQEVLANTASLVIEVAVDSLFFNNIAKLRALRFLLESLQEKCQIPNFEIMTRNSLREQTLYDPWMNMLRNTTSASAAFLGGADIISIDSYDHIASYYGNSQESDLGMRQAKNVFHVLNEESYLSSVQDCSQGSYAIESLTTEYIDLSFKHFRLLEKKGGIFANLDSFSEDVKQISAERLTKVANLKSTLAGINNFANTDDDLEDLFKTKLKLELKDELFPLRRNAFAFEQIRNTFTTKSFKPVVLTYGDESKLSARIMFCVNYFEVLGHKVEVKHISGVTKDITASIIILCAADADYAELVSKLPKANTPMFIAGNKYHQEGMTNIYLGQNMLSVLGGLSELF